MLAGRHTRMKEKVKVKSRTRKKKVGWGGRGIDRTKEKGAHNKKVSNRA